MLRRRGSSVAARGRSSADALRRRWQTGRADGGSGGPHRLRRGGLRAPLHGNWALGWVASLRRLIVFLHLNVEEIAHGFIVDARHHVFEHSEGFLFELDQGVFLALA